MDDRLNISTLVYMLQTNVKIDPNKLGNLFDEINPIEYSNAVNGIIKISVRGNTKGLCKKLVFRRSHSNNSQVKNFRNQISFYVRIIDKMSIYLKKVIPDFSEGIYPNEIRNINSNNLPELIYQYKKGQTAFQFKKIYLNFDSSRTSVNDKITLFTSVTRKNQNKELKYIDYTITQNDIDKNLIEFEFDNGCYAHSLYLISKDINPKIYLDFVVEVNMFMFTSGKIKIAGCTREYQINQAMSVLIDNLNFNNEKMLDYFGVTKEEFNIFDKEPVMINSDFASDYEINRYKLDYFIRSKYNIMSSFEPNTHPAVIIKYYHNTDYKINNGKCQCREKYDLTNLDIKSRLCTGRGNGCGPCQCKTVTILVFQSGKVILTGARRLYQVKDGFNFIDELLCKNKNILDRSVTDTYSHEEFSEEFSINTMH